MKKLRSIAILVAVILLSSISYVQAAGFSFLTEASATTVEPGDTVTIDLSVADIDAGELGINTIEAVLEYDKNVFEAVSSTDFAGLNNWSITYNNESGENEGKFVAVIVQDGVTENQDIGRLTLKVKEGVEDQATNIVFKGIKTNDGTNEIPTTDKTITININSPEPVVPQEPQEEEPQNTTSPDPIPQTGETTFIIIGGCIVAVVIAVISYMLYRRNRY